MSSNPNLFSRKEAAEYIRMSVAWLAAVVGRSGPKATRIGGRIFYMRADLDAFLRECRECREGEEVIECQSISEDKSTGVSFESRESSSALAQAKEIRQRLRRKLDASKLRKSKPLPPADAA